MLRQLFAVSAVCGLFPFTAPAAVLSFNELSPGRPYSGGGSYSNTSAFSSGGATFNNSYTDFGGGFESWFGWAYSNTTDTATAGYTNQFSAYPGGGSDGSGGVAAGTTFLVASEDTFSPFPPTITFDAGQYATSLRITNTTYSYLSMLNGDSFAKKFGGSSGNDADWFKLTISGFTSENVATGTVEFYLADFRFEDNSLDYIVDDWAMVDLSGLGSNTSVLQFTLSSSDNGSFGMNTPATFAIDDITVVPEPSTYALLGFGVAVLAFLHRRKRCRS